MNFKKLTVGIVFGGQSVEHEISLQSARNVVAAIDRKKYRPVLIGIEKSGDWHLYDSHDFLHHPDDPKRIRLKDAGDQVAILPGSGGQITNLSRPGENDRLDVIFPILHGPLGEDGTIQGLLKLADVPCVGSGVLGSAIGMDKEVMKRLLRDANIPTADFISVGAYDDLPAYEVVVEKLGEPFFVKPACLGSSVGVCKVHNAEEYEQAVNTAFDYDNSLLLEAYMEGRELECAVLGNRHPIASVPGEILCEHEFYSYQAKYLDENGAALQIPAKVPLKLTTRLQQLAIDTFKALCCKGLARVDFFITKEQQVVVNEINTLPGFTSISMFPRLWQASGICYQALINRLILLALERFDYEHRPNKLLPIQ